MKSISSGKVENLGSSPSVEAILDYYQDFPGYSLVLVGKFFLFLCVAFMSAKQVSKQFAFSS